MVFLDKRINGICDEMKKYAVRQRVPVEGIYYKEGNFLRPRDAEADGTPFAILLVNLLTPFLDLIRPKPFGAR